MVGTEYGMAWEMTHGLVAGPVLPAKVSEGEEEARCNATVAGRTNKEASIEAPDRGHRAEIDQGARRDKREREREREIGGEAG